jgi:hypothetical protein
VTGGGWWMGNNVRLKLGLLLGESWLPDLHWCPHGPSDYGIGEGEGLLC